MSWTNNLKYWCRSMSSAIGEEPCNQWELELILGVWEKVSDIPRFDYLLLSCRLMIIWPTPLLLVETLSIPYDKWYQSLFTITCQSNWLPPILRHATHIFVLYQTVSPWFVILMVIWLSSMRCHNQSHKGSSKTNFTCCSIYYLFSHLQRHLFLLGVPMYHFLCLCQHAASSRNALEDRGWSLNILTTSRSWLMN